MVGKQGTQSARNGITRAHGSIVNIDDNNRAWVKLSTGNMVETRVDMLPGKSAAPLEGESWIVDRSLGEGWMLVMPTNYTGGDRDYTAPVLGNGWNDVAGAYVPTGYLRDSEGWVHLRGRMSGGLVGVAFTLPEDYRPDGIVTFLVPVDAGSGQLTVNANGDVAVTTASGQTSLDGVRFLASRA